MFLLDCIRPCDMSEDYIFISYSGHDRELVWRDVLEFQNRGYNIWLDDKNIDKKKNSWKTDALKAIERYNCKLVVFYFSPYSLTSPNCYAELCATKSERAKAIHNNEVGYVVVETEHVKSIEEYKNNAHRQLMGGKLFSSEEEHDREERALILYDFIKNFFDTNNEKVRVHPKDEQNRKMDYYDEIVAVFPDSAKIYPEVSGDMPGQAHDSSEGMAVASDNVTETARGTHTASFNDRNVTVENNRYLDQNDMLRISAENGDSRAQYDLGYRYYKGNGIAQDYNAAAYWFGRSAQQGNPIGQKWLAYCYENGIGVTRDYVQALRLYNQSAEQGDSYSQYALGLLYYRGNGVAQDYKAAVYWFDRSAQQGSTDGQKWLAYCYENGLGVDTDYTQAAELYRRAAHQGEAYAQHKLGFLYYKGNGVKQDYNEAVYWFGKSAQQGDPEGQKWLAYCYEKGLGVERDYLQAAELYRQSAEQGDSYSQYNLGILYYKGNGVAQDHAKAVYWFGKSADLGDSGGQKWLAYCYEKGISVTQDYARAAELYRQSAEQGDSYSQYNLGILYYKGNGVAQNYTEAVYWFRKSADQGDADGKKWLDYCIEQGIV